MEKMKVESFNLDHTKVKAPYVRKASKIIGPQGDIVQKYDIRFCQPNVEAMPIAAMHAIEHIVAESIRDYLENVVDLSPMGCRTGFYFIKFGESSEEEIANAVEKCLLKVLEVPDAASIPGATEIQCGNYKDHDLENAKLWAKRWIDGIHTKGVYAF